MKLDSVVTAVFIASLIAPIASAAPSKEAMQGIIDRCKSQMGEYGAAMVKACADQDIEGEEGPRFAQYTNETGYCSMLGKSISYKSVLEIRDTPIPKVPS